MSVSFIVETVFLLTVKRRQIYVRGALIPIQGTTNISVSRSSA